jgi:hypothetical protein
MPERRRIGRAALVERARELFALRAIHMTGVNMLPSSGRFSVIVPIGPLSSYKIVW